MSNPPPYTISRSPLLPTSHFWQLSSSRARIDLSALSIERGDWIYFVFARSPTMTTTMENPPDPPRPLRPVPFSSILFIWSLPLFRTIPPRRVRGRVPLANPRGSSRLLTTLVCRVRSTDWPPSLNVWRESVGAFEFEAIGRVEPKPSEHGRPTNSRMRASHAHSRSSPASRVTTMSSLRLRAFANLRDADTWSLNSALNSFRSLAARIFAPNLRRIIRTEMRNARR